MIMKDAIVKFAACFFIVLEHGVWLAYIVMMKTSPNERRKGHARRFIDHLEQFM